MTLNEALVNTYHWLEAQQTSIVIGAVALPIVGTVAARIGKGGKTDADGRFIASLVVAIGLTGFVLEILAVYVAHRVMDRSLLDANLLLVLAPPVCMAACLAGIRWVFPLNELASVRTFTDLAAFVGVCLAILWVFSKFRGWGILFWGSLPELLAIGAFALVLLRRLYKRAFVGRSAVLESA